MNSQSALTAPVADAWLSLQCQIIPGISRAAVFPQPTSSQAPVATAAWPEGSEVSAGMHSAAGRSLAKQQPVVSRQQQSAANEDVQLNIACPILIDGNVLGAIAVETTGADQQQQKAVLQLLKWGGMWLQLIMRADSGTDILDATALHVLTTALQQPDFHTSSTAIATEAALALQAERVSIGMCKGAGVKLAAISSCASFDPRANLVRDIEVAMAESLGQNATLQYPSSTPEGSEAQARLCANQGSSACFTLPLLNAGQPVGAVTIEYRGDDIAASGEHMQSIATAVGPFLRLKQQAEPSLVASLSHSVRATLHKASGGGRTRGKFVSFACALALGLLVLVPADYRVASDAVLEGSIQRAVVAPMDGFIKIAGVRPGDTVTEGQILGALDDQELKLERLRWDGQRTQLLREHREALASRERSQIGILNSQIAQAEAQLELLDAQLERTELVAPFAGIITSGDLSQKMGAPVERGNILFTVAPLNSYRVVLSVNEQDISELSEGQAGELVLASQPDRVLSVSVKSITPVSTAEDGRNFFRVEAELQGAVDSLRPGMQGVAKINVGSRNQLWIWTHKLVEWLQLSFWSWLG